MFGEYKILYIEKYTWKYKCLKTYVVSYWTNFHYNLDY